MSSLRSVFLFAALLIPFVGVEAADYPLANNPMQAPAPVESPYAFDTLELPESMAARPPVVAPDAGVYRLEGAALRRFATLEEALDALPGFRVRRQGGLGGYSALSFRGARAAQIDVFVDGIRLNQDGDAAPDLGKWPLLWFSSLEARSGIDGADGAPASGSGALARIDLSTRDESRANFQARAGSYAAYEAAATVQGPIPLGWTLSAGVQGQSARNDYPFFSDNGTQHNPEDDGTWRMENNAYQSQGARAALRREGAAGRQTVSALWIARRKEYPGLFPANAEAHSRRSDWLGAWRLERFEGPVTWETGLQARRFEDAYRDPNQSLGYLSYESARVSTSVEADARARTTLTSNLRARADLRLRAEETKPLVTPFSDAFSSPDASRGEAQGGLAGDVALGRTVVATFEARGAFIRFRADGLRSLPDTSGYSLQSLAATDYHPVALRTGIQWTPATASSSAHAFSLNLRLEQRAPTSGELLGDNLGIIHKLDLQPEEARSVSLGHLMKIPPPPATGPASLSVQSTAFWNTYRRPIRLKAHGASSFMRYENDADYRSVGLETLSSLTTRHTESALSLTLQEASILQGSSANNQPAYQSPLESHAEFFLKTAPGRTLRARAGVLADFRSAYYPGDANLPGSRRGAEWELGAHAAVERGPARLAFDARNLTGRQYRDFAYSPRSGRSYSLSLSYSL